MHLLRLQVKYMREKMFEYLFNDEIRELLGKMA